MNNRRKFPRTIYKANINVSSIFQSGSNEATKKNIPIVVADISQTGMGFEAEQELPINSFFDCKIEFKEDDKFFCVMRIVRCKHVGNNKYSMGAEFVGAPECLESVIGEYVRKTGV